MLANLVPLAVPAGHSGGSSNPVAFYVIGSVIVVLGIVFFAKPEWQWKSTRWQFKNPDAMEPSAKGLAARRVSAGIVAVVGIVMLVVAATR